MGYDKASRVGVETSVCLVGDLSCTSRAESSLKGSK